MTRSDQRCFFFAGGGTGGHLYPALAVAEEITELLPAAEILFFCSSREVDARILSPSGYDFLPLPAVGFSASPVRCIRFGAQFVKSYYFAKQILRERRQGAVVMGTGGFVSAPVILAARSLRIPVALLNVDSVPGKANRLMARYAAAVFVQFQQTRQYFAKTRAQVCVTGCPLRRDFTRPAPAEALRQYQIDPGKKVLLITGASSGSRSINQALAEILPALEPFADTWQVVHITGAAHFDQVQQTAGRTAISYRPIDYCHNMPALLAAADLVVGRAGAVSVAEYAAAGVPAVCLPYPYHKDRHQVLNARPLVEAGAAVIVDEAIDNPQQTVDELRRVLTERMSDPSRLAAMRNAARSIAKPDAAKAVAKTLLQTI